MVALAHRQMQADLAKIDKILYKYDQKTNRKVLLKAGRQALKVVAKPVKANVPVDRGVLKASIGIIAKRAKNDNRNVTMRVGAIAKRHKTKGAQAAARRKPKRRAQVTRTSAITNQNAVKKTQGINTLTESLATRIKRDIAVSAIMLDHRGKNIVLPHWRANEKRVYDVFKNEIFTTLAKIK